MRLLSWLLVLAAGPLAAAELKFDFGRMPLDQPPPGFRSLVSGEGKPGDWKVILADFPPMIAPISSNAPNISQRAVLAQLAQDPTDEHAPMLVCDGETFTDFKVTTRFKTVSGQAERMAGLAFRMQDEKNFYYIRANSLSNNVRFFKLVNGVRSVPIGRDVPVPAGVWHELTIECRGNQIQAWLDGKEVIPPLTDTSFMRGKLAFWTKSDSVSYFVDTVVTYTPLVPPAQALVRATLKEYPKLLGLKVYAVTGTPREVRVIAAGDEQEIGQPGGRSEQDVLDTGNIYYGKGKGTAAVLMPLRDRNGEIIAVARVVLKPVFGQTEQNALNRARPIVQEMQAKVQNTTDLFE
jgi:hypothetical protein